MKRFFHLLVFLCFGLTTSLTAQVIYPITEAPLGRNAQQIVINTLTGIPVLKTESEYVGINTEYGSVMWAAGRNSLSQRPDFLYDNSPLPDFEDITGTPYVFASGNLIDVTDGETVIDGTDQDLRVLRTYHIMPEENMVLLEIGGRRAIHLYALNVLKGGLEWEVQLRKVPVLPPGFAREVPGTDLGPYTAPYLSPYFDTAGNLIYPSDKHLSLIDTSLGQLKWNKKISTRYIVTNEKGNRMVIAEEHFGSGETTSSSADDLFGDASEDVFEDSFDGGPPEGSFRKRLRLIDTGTGQSIWKKKGKMGGNVLYVEPYGDDFLVVHDKGMNVYDFDDPTPKGRWKKDYEVEGVLSVEFGPDGLMVYSPQKRMLIDPVSGEEKWKEAETTDTKPRGFMWETVSAYKPPTERVGNFDVTFYEDYFIVGNDATSSTYNYDMIVVEDDRIAVIDYVYDDNILTDIEMSMTQLDGDEPERKVESVRLRHGIHGIDKVDGGYFVYNDRGFLLYRYDPEEGFEEVRKGYYPDPTATKRFFIGLGLVAGSAFVPDELAASLIQRQINGRVEEDFAFFFTRDGKEGPTLFKVDKDTGDEVAKLRFDDLTPLFEIDYQSGRLFYQAKKRVKIFELK